MPTIMVSSSPTVHAPVVVTIPGRFGPTFLYLGRILVKSAEEGGLTELTITPKAKGELRVAADLFGAAAWRQIQACMRQPAGDRKVTMSSEDYEQLKTKLLADAAKAYEGESRDFDSRRDPRGRR